MREKEISVRELQLLEYDVLKTIDAFCKKYDICYFLSGGTLLGAVRHKGFIPWDDDVDIMMPRPDYDRFIKLAHEAFSHTGEYAVGELTVHPEWTRPTARVWKTNMLMDDPSTTEIEVGIFVDVFPIDGMPESQLSQRILYSRVKLNNILRRAAWRVSFREHENLRTLKQLIGLWAKRKGARYYAEKMDNLVKNRKYDVDGTVAAILPSHYGMKEILPGTAFGGVVLLEFEDDVYPAPVGYDLYLSHLYGDYMQMPPAEEQKSQHSYTITQIK